MLTRSLRLLLLALVVATGCATPSRPPPEQPSARQKPLVEGLASFYGARFHGRPTASGERFDRHAMTAAHRKLRFGTCLRVVNVRNGRSVEVRVNDRGPFAGKRVLDLSEGAARAIGMIDDGVVPVKAWRCQGDRTAAGR